METPNKKKHENGENGECGGCILLILICVSFVLLCKMWFLGGLQIGDNKWNLNLFPPSIEKIEE